MMSNSYLSRRRLLLGASGLAAAGLALAGCTTTAAPGGGTTYTLDLTKSVTEGKAIIAALQNALAIPVVAGLLGSNLALAEGVLAGAQGALTELMALTGGSVSATVDTATAKKLVDTLIGDAQTGLGYVQAIAPQLPSPYNSTVANAVGGALALLPILELSVSLAPGAVPTDEGAKAKALSLGPWHPGT